MKGPFRFFGAGAGALEAEFRASYQQPGSDAPREVEREAACRTPTPIVAVTANTLAGDREACFASGMNDFLAKPYSLEQLQMVMERCAMSQERLSPPADSKPWQACDVSRWNPRSAVQDGARKPRSLGRHEAADGR